MNPAQHDLDHLHQLMQQQRDQAQQLTAYLGDIRQSIAENRIDALQALLSEGCPAFASLENLQQQQNEQLRQLGFEPTFEGLQALLDNTGSSALQAQGEALSSDLEAMKKALLINDLLIKKNQHRVRQSIKLLSGRDTTPQRSTYSRNGLSDDSDHEQRSLANA